MKDKKTIETTNEVVEKLLNDIENGKIDLNLVAFDMKLRIAAVVQTYKNDDKNNKITEDELLLIKHEATRQLLRFMSDLTLQAVLNGFEFERSGERIFKVTIAPDDSEEVVEEINKRVADKIPNERIN